MNRSLLCVAAVVAAVVAASALDGGAARAQAFVSPLVVETSPGIITVANSGAQPIRLGVEAADFDQVALYQLTLSGAPPKFGMTHVCVSA